MRAQLDKEDASSYKGKCVYDECASFEQYSTSSKYKKMSS